MHTDVASHNALKQADMNMTVGIETDISPIGLLILKTEDTEFLSYILLMDL
jgi:hypothetical protein